MRWCARWSVPPLPSSPRAATPPPPPPRFHNTFRRHLSTSPASPAPCITPRETPLLGLSVSYFLFRCVNDLLAQTIASFCSCESWGKTSSHSDFYACKLCWKCLYFALLAIACIEVARFNMWLCLWGSLSVSVNACVREKGRVYTCAWVGVRVGVGVCVCMCVCQREVLPPCVNNESETEERRPGFVSLFLSPRNLSLF